MPGALEINIFRGSATQLRQLHRRVSHGNRQLELIQGNFHPNSIILHADCLHFSVFELRSKNPVPYDECPQYHAQQVIDLASRADEMYVGDMVLCRPGPEQGNTSWIERIQEQVEKHPHAQR